MQDQTERFVVIGRYISEVHDGFKLHPIDFVDVGTGATTKSLIDPNLTYINPVNMPHPLLDVVVTGSSGTLFCWSPEVWFPMLLRLSAELSLVWFQAVVIMCSLAVLAPLVCLASRGG